ncbi:MAG: hypothetical protein EOM62_14775 [Bacteroidia bacterium]|nr:hypothetical protein [Bacteroidia bacterium]
MKLSIQNVLYAKRPFATILVVFFYVYPVSAEDKTPDIQTYLPLFERNSLGRKILDVRYSFKPRQKLGPSKGLIVYPQDVHLVYDVETGKYRIETKVYDRPNETNRYSHAIKIWDGNKSLNWTRNVYPKLGNPFLGRSMRETPGVASIGGNPDRPFFLYIYYLTNDQPLTKVVSENNSRLTSIAGDAITIETKISKFLFSKKTGALGKIVCYIPTSMTNDNEKIIHETLNLSNHVECSGFLVPLRIVRTTYDTNGEKDASYEYSVDPQSLRMLDTVDDSVFSVALPAGCYVDDDIGKRSYTVTTIDALPNDVEAVRKALEKMLEQAQEQKAAVEQK